MEWSKIKNIMIIMLVATNLMLLAFAVGPKTQQRLQDDEALVSAVSLLEARGISVPEDHEQFQNIARQMLLTQDRSGEAECAKKLFGTTDVAHLSNEVRKYSNEKGSVQFHGDGTFSAAFVYGQFPVRGDTSSEYATEIMRLLDSSVEVIEIVAQGNEIRVVVGQLWDEIPMLGYGATVVYRDGYLVAIENGKRLVGTTTFDGARPITPASALVHFIIGIDTLGDICSEIQNVHLAYVDGLSLSGQVRLIPIWLVQTNTSVYILNLLDGSLTRATN